MQVPPSVLYGRDSEREALHALLVGARASRSGVVVLRGEPGVGKSSLLTDLLEHAGGMQVLRAVGVESESELAFAGVHQLVWPLLRRIDEIPEGQAAALRSALGLQAARSVEDRFLIGAAVLSLLALAAEASPVLCIVDDAHWLDAASADTLAFAARRLNAEPIALVFAARVGDRRTFDAPGLPEMHLAGLDNESAAALLANRTPVSLAPDVAARLVSETRGNPLALIELPSVLHPDQAEGRAPLGERLPLTEAMEAVYVGRARDLRRDSQLVALLAAADDTGELDVVLRAARALDLDPAALDELETAGLLRIAEKRIQFRHPLVRSALYQAAPFADRRTVHEALSSTLDRDRDLDRRLWHKAAATVGVDDELADELERSAERALARTGHAAASAALERAAGFTGDEREQSRRLAAAAWAAWLGGRAEAAVALLDRARRLDNEPLTAADVAHLRSLIEVQRGSPARAHEILMASVEDIVSVDPAKAGAMLVQAGEAANFVGDLAGEIAAGRRAAQLLKETGLEQFELTMMSGVSELLAGDPQSAGALLAEALSRAEASANPRRFSWAGSGAFYLGDFAHAYALWQRFAADSRSEGAIALLAVALAYLAYIEMFEGRFAAASASASEGLTLARETGQENAATFHLSTLALIAARSGSEGECRERAEAVFKAAEQHGLGIHFANATLALAEYELAVGRPSAALAHLEALWSQRPGTTSVSVQLLGLPDLVEAAVRSGQPEKAAEPLRFWEGWVEGTGGPSTVPLLMRCRALLEEGQARLARYEDALSRHGDRTGPFERARTELLYGEALRRERQPKKAREHLRMALDSFEQLGADPWAERARAELRASGETARRRDPSLIDELTAQELQIARAVATGATNKEVAAQLFLSPRTVEFHLRHIFAKLGISSRSQLAATGLQAEAPETAVPA
jgi:DNA-binding CsgD family transcriptional regulator